MVLAFISCSVVIHAALVRDTVVHDFAEDSEVYHSILQELEALAPQSTEPEMITPEAIEPDCGSDPPYLIMTMGAAGSGKSSLPTWAKVSLQGLSNFPAQEDITQLLIDNFVEQDAIYKQSLADVYSERYL